MATTTGVYHTSYRADLALRHTHLEYVRLALALAVVAALPFYASPFWLHVLDQIGIAVIGAIGLNILVGYTGQISLGQGGFLAVGAYSAGVVATKSDLSPLVGMLVAVLVTAVVGAFFGLPALRLKGLYLAIATLASQQIIVWLIVHWDFLTGGVEAIVVDPARYKVLAFAVSSAFVGLAGALTAYWTQILTWERFTLDVSILYLAMIIVGGLGSVAGSIYGAAFMIAIPAYLDQLSLRVSAESILATDLPAIKLLIFGLTIVLFLVFEPRGLARIWQRAKDYLRLWPFRY